MGFSSSNCEACRKPLLSKHVTSYINQWMTEAVIIEPIGRVLTGSYDGYGHLLTDDSTDDIYIFESTVYHHDCWVVAGKPTTFLGESENAEDQGFFFEDGTYDIPSPLQA